MKKLPALGFFVLGAVYFLVMTDFLGKSSETALVDGSMGLVPGVLGAIGALIGSRSVGRAIVFGLIFAVIGAVGLIVFFQVLWPML
jgi:hypothetical protein